MTKRIRYAGALGRPIPQRESFAAALRAKEIPSAWDDWLTDKQVKGLFALLDHYHIPRQDQNRWFLLAFRLGQDHVPGLRVAKGRDPGRPRKPMTLADIAKFGAKGKPGRKRKNTPEYYRKFLVAVARTCEANGWRGRGAGKRALEKIIRDYARKAGVSETKELATNLGYFQKRLSEAKKQFPEIAEKFLK